MFDGIQRFFGGNKKNKYTKQIIMEKQTAVEWLFEKMAQTPMTNWYEIREQALDIEKQQIMNACDYFADYPFVIDDYFQYYDETYKK